MRTWLPLFLLSFVSLTTLGCGVRTGLLIGSDAGDAGPRPDIGPSDARFDAPHDGGSCRTTADCDDGRTCNGFEQCVGGACVGGPTPDCNDFIDCTTDQCVEGAGCISRPNDMLCGPGLRCDMFIGCTPIVTGCREDFECDDGRFCNGTERCDRDTRTCVSGAPVACDDGVGCTDDSCIEAFGCVSEANPGLCTPPAICDRFSGCVVRSCMVASDCDDGDPCNGTERCGSDFRCVAGTRLDCNDGSECTIDRCLPFMGCASFIESEVCSDGRDNDCNGLVDCGDFACSGRPECGCVPTGPIEFACLDGRDDDCDGAFDCGDRDCAGTPDCGPCASFEFDCLNGRDDDCDGIFDCEDPSCRGTPGCGCFPTSMTEIRCRDGIDDDCDGLFDCADFDCRTRPACAPDGGVRDSGLIRDSGPIADGGMVTRELGVALCTNGIDDDRDARADCADPDCSPFGPGGECCNNVDDNGDGNIDEFTCRCFDDSVCTDHGSLEQVCWATTYSVCAPRCDFYGGDTFCMMFVPDSPRCNRTTGECTD